MCREPRTHCLCHFTNCLAGPHTQERQNLRNFNNNAKNSDQHRFVLEPIEHFLQLKHQLGTDGKNRWNRKHAKKRTNKKNYDSEPLPLATSTPRTRSGGVMKGTFDKKHRLRAVSFLGIRACARCQSYWSSERGLERTKGLNSSGSGLHAVPTRLHTLHLTLLSRKNRSDSRKENILLL